ncbi:MAG: gene transfer agent family protein [Alphaproteobacteria bacterium]
MANAERGEIDVTFDGASYTLRPTFQALCEIEDETGMGIAAIVQRFRKAEFGVREVTAIMVAGMTAAHGDAAPARAAVEAAIGDGRFDALATTAAAFLAAALAGIGAPPREAPPKKPPPPGTAV